MGAAGLAMKTSRAASRMRTLLRSASAWRPRLRCSVDMRYSLAELE